MEREAKAYLWDIRQAARRILDATSGKPFEEYEDDWLTRSAVERQFEIIGQATTLLAERDQSAAQRLAAYPQIIGFRNILAHEYRNVRNRTVWGVIENHLPDLIQDINAILKDD